MFIRNFDAIWTAMFHVYLRRRTQWC